MKKKHKEGTCKVLGRSVVFSAFYADFCFCSILVIITTLNFQCRGVVLIWIIVGQGPVALAVGAGRGCLDICTLIYLWETARYRLKYCLKGLFNPKQPTNQILFYPIT